MVPRVGRLRRESVPAPKTTRSGAEGRQALDPEIEQPFSSTTWEWRRVKIRRPPEANETVSAKPKRWSGLPSRRPREKVMLTVHYRGGPEAWYQIEARGRTGNFHGATAIHDVMAEINRQR